MPEWDLVRPQLSGIVLSEHEFAASAVPAMLTAHETGHWLGLMHTFIGPLCTTECGYTHGDLCLDTPTDMPSHLCNSNFCGHKNMNQNIMDYSSCLKMFTKDQLKRMKCLMSTYRGSFALTNPCESVVSSIVFTPVTSTEPICYNQTRIISTTLYPFYSYEWSVEPAGVAVLTSVSPTTYASRNPNKKY